MSDEQQDDWHFVIRKGAVYVYTSALPVGCQGGLYRVIDFLIDVPTYQPRVLVRCLAGKDAGLRFCTTEMNFARRYQPADDQPPANAPLAEEASRMPVARVTSTEVLLALEGDR